MLKQYHIFVLILICCQLFPTEAASTNFKVHCLTDEGEKSLVVQWTSYFMANTKKDLILRTEFYYTNKRERRKFFVLECQGCGNEIKRYGNYYLNKCSLYCKICAPKFLIKKEKYKKPTKICISCNKELSIKKFSTTGSGHIKSKCIRCSNLLATFNINSNDYDNLLQKQGGVCAICKNKNVSNNIEKLLVVDHDHKTEKIRGLLCNSCNFAIGLFKDNTDILNNAIKYLKLKK